MARRLNKNLVALGSAAIVTVYAIGFARTGWTGTDAEADGAVGASPSAIAQTTADPATAVARAIASATPSPPSAASAPSGATTVAYRDGVFTGSGTSRFGGFEVAVTIEGGAITRVDITRATTRYPASRVSALPGQVIARQSANVDMVSGATYSARAFKDAVAQALAQAATGSETSG